MIQKTRNIDISQSLQSKFSIDKFHNPYLSKFTLKLIPSLSQNREKIQWVSPFDTNNHIYISQSLPIYKSQNFRTSLLWRQSINRKMGRAFFGMANQFKTQNLWTFKTKFMFGNNFLYNIQAHKKFNNSIEAYLFHHGMYDNIKISKNFGIGIKKNNLSATLHSRYGLDLNATVQYTRPLPENLFLTIKTQNSITQDLSISQFMQKNSATIDYFYSDTVKLSGGVALQIKQENIFTKFEIQKSTQAFGHFQLSCEYKNNSSIIYVGYKNPTLNLVLPVCIVNNPIPIIISAMTYIFGYLYRNKNKPIIQLEKKQQQVRRNQLKLISDKANLNYQKQRNLAERGLLIQQAYVGPKQFIDKLTEFPDIGIALLRDQQLKKHVFDITVCLRFYVIKGQLKLKKGDKTHLLGFFCNNQNDQILIRCRKNLMENIIKVKMTDHILIK